MATVILTAPSGGTATVMDSSLATAIIRPQNAVVGDQVLTPDIGWDRFDDRDSNIYWNVISDSSWAQVTDPLSWGGTYTWCTYSGSGSYLRFNFTGTRFRILARTFSSCSDRTLVNIDGINYQFTEKLTTGTESIVLVFEVTELADTEHFVTITASPTNYGYTYIDAFDIDAGCILKPFNIPAVYAEGNATAINTLSASINFLTHVDISGDASAQGIGLILTIIPIPISGIVDAVITASGSGNIISVMNVNASGRANNMVDMSSSVTIAIVTDITTSGSLLVVETSSSQATVVPVVYVNSSGNASVTEWSYLINSQIQILISGNATVTCDGKLGIAQAVYAKGNITAHVECNAYNSMNFYLSGDASAKNTSAGVVTDLPNETSTNLLWSGPLYSDGTQPYTDCDGFMLDPFGDIFVWTNVYFEGCWPYFGKMSGLTGELLWSIPGGQFWAIAGDCPIPNTDTGLSVSAGAVDSNGDVFITWSGNYSYECGIQKLSGKNNLVYKQDEWGQMQGLNLIWQINKVVSYASQIQLFCDVDDNLLVSYGSQDLLYKYSNADGSTIWYKPLSAFNNTGNPNYALSFYDLYCSPSTGAIVFCVIYSDSTKSIQVGFNLSYIDTSGNLLQSINYYDMWEAGYISSDPFGNVYIAGFSAPDSMHISQGKTVKKLLPNGNEIWSRSDLLRPEGIATDPRDGSLWVGCGNNSDGLRHLNPLTGATDFVDLSVTCAWFLDVDKNGDLYLGGQWCSRVSGNLLKYRYNLPVISDFYFGYLLGLRSNNPPVMLPNQRYNISQFSTDFKNGFLIGTIASNPPSANRSWSKNDSSYATSIDVDSTGAVVVAYWNNSSAPGLRKIGSEGSSVWYAKTSYASKVRVDPCGWIIAIHGGGSGLHRYSCDGKLQWEQPENTFGYVQDFDIDSSGNIFAVVGLYIDYTRQLVFKFDTTGLRNLWNSYSKVEYTYGNAKLVRLDKGDNVYVWFELAVVKFDNTGNFVWAYTSNEWGTSYKDMAVSESGEVYIVYNYEICKIASSGQADWAFPYEAKCISVWGNKLYVGDLFGGIDSFDTETGIPIKIGLFSGSAQNPPYGIVPYYDYVYAALYAWQGYTSVSKFIG